MKIDFLTLFPEMFQGVLGSSILQKAQEKEAVRFDVINFRAFSDNKHQTVDDYPYGGGAGMVLKPQPVFDAVEKLTAGTDAKPRIILVCPQGERYTQKKAEELAEEEHLMFICGHYEGYDERIREHLVTDEISIGDFVLTGESSCHDDCRQRCQAFAGRPRKRSIPRGGFLQHGAFRASSLYEASRL